MPGSYMMTAVRERETRAAAPHAGLRVLVVEDDAFTRTLVVGALSGIGFSVICADSVARAVEILRAGDFHAILSDLDLGDGPSGADLMWHVADEWPWMGAVVLSSHSSPQLAVGAGVRLPDGVGYLVKSDLVDFRLLSGAISSAVRGGRAEPDVAPDVSRIAVTPAQADVLRLLSAGMSTTVIARRRATSVRAAEMMIARLYEKLGLRPRTDRDPRTSAVLMWQQGRVRVQ